MKLVGIAGSIGEQSYNRELLQFIQKQYSDLVDIELVNIDELPVFNPDEDLSDSEAVQSVYRKVNGADGVILATPEHNHTVPAALKNVIEWLSYKLHPFEDKPVWIVGASYHNQGSSRAQLHLKQILESPGVNAVVMPGDEFLLSNAKQAFDADGNLKDQRTINFLNTLMRKFIKFVKVIDLYDAPDPENAAAEDLNASGRVNTTIPDVDMFADDWVEQAAKQVHAATGGDYVKLNRGVLTVDQLNAFLNTIPIELTFVDDNNQFIYYNHNEPAAKMLAPRTPNQVGDPLAAVHPQRAIEHVKQVINVLRSGESDLVAMPVPGNGPDKHIMHYYKAMHDENGRYRGVNEWVLDIMPIINYYLAVTGQKLVTNPDQQPVSPFIGLDTMTSASKKDVEQAVKPDTVSGASESSAVETDFDDGIEIGELLNSGGNVATEGVQPKGVVNNKTPQRKPVTPQVEVDTVSGASEK